jgi:hypothetical protein
MLRTASDEVTKEIREAQALQDAKVANILNAAGETGGAISAIVRAETEKAVAVPGYAPGQKAQIRFKERQELAHQALTSTQGRRSAVPVIARLVWEALVPSVKGLAVVERNAGDPVAEVEWGMQIDGGQNERNPNFNFIDTAARSLTHKLLRELRVQDVRDAKYELVVTPINAVADRRVGWRATLYS